MLNILGFLNPLFLFNHCTFNIIKLVPQAYSADVTVTDRGTGRKPSVKSRKDPAKTGSLSFMKTQTQAEVDARRAREEAYAAAEAEAERQTELLASLQALAEASKAQSAALREKIDADIKERERVLAEDKAKRMKEEEDLANRGRRRLALISTTQQGVLGKSRVGRRKVFGN